MDLGSQVDIGALRWIRRLLGEHKGFQVVIGVVRGFKVDIGVLRLTQGVLRWI